MQLQQVMTQRTKYKFRYGTVLIEYFVVKTRRRKTSEIIVEDKDTVEVRAPFNKPDHEIQKIIQNKASWILKKQREYREMNPQIIRPTFKENSTLSYLGKNYPLKIIRAQGKNSIRFVDGQFLITLLPSTKSLTCESVKTLYEHWLMKTARPIFKNRIEAYSKKIGVIKPEKIVIKNLKKRWGSLGKKCDTMNLNVNLVKAPEDIIKYIILHELCHLKVKEHSHHYWDLLHKFMPDYQDKINWLNTNGNNLLGSIEFR